MSIVREDGLKALADWTAGIGKHPISRNLAFLYGYDSGQQSAQVELAHERQKRAELEVELVKARDFVDRLSERCANYNIDVQKLCRDHDEAMERFCEAVKNIRDIGELTKLRQAVEPKGKANP